MNFTAIALSAFSRVVLVVLWWSPPVFLGRWMKLTQHTPETVKHVQLGGTILAVAGSLIMATVFEFVIVRIGVQTVLDGGLAGLTVWVGFVLPPMLSPVVYERKSFELFLINSGFQLVALLSMGAVLAAFIK